MVNIDAPNVEWVMEFRGLRVRYRSRAGLTVDAIQDVDLGLRECETLGVIGESGAGKSTLARVALGLVAPNVGEVLYRGKSIIHFSRTERLDFRRSVSAVFQEPLGQLNPKLSVESNIGEALVVHKGRYSRDERRALIYDSLQRVGLRHEVGRRLPGALSGGQQQRVSVARALVGDPEVIILDEPTSSLDLSVRAGLLLLLRELKEERALTFLIITHDLQSVRALADRVVVMKQGRIVEEAPTSQIFSAPAEEYTRSLISRKFGLHERKYHRL